VWFGQQFDVDALALSAVVATAVPDVTVGTSVVPINPRHPLLIASAAQTAQAAAAGRFTLGLGLAGHDLERRAYGLPRIKAIGRLREHLTVLRQVFAGENVDFSGSDLRAAVPGRAAVVSGGSPIPTYVAAMGPRALAAAGELADGTIPFLAGPQTIADYLRPSIEAAASAAGRPRPRIIAVVPVSVTASVEAARADAKRALGPYDRLASYQAIVAREGRASAADMAVIGSSARVADELETYLKAGADELVLYPFQTDLAVLESIWELAGQL
jgi:F420-dependent oxidoreductase-like protein